MKKLYKNKYRIDSHRMPNWDYSRNGKYFITMCILDMRCILGEVVGKEMVLSEFGKIVEEKWFESFEIRKELYYDEFIIMPNHIHAILIINHPNTFVNRKDKYTDVNNDNTCSRSPLQRQPKSISSFMAGFKSACYSPIDDLIDLHNENSNKISEGVIEHCKKPKEQEFIIKSLPLNTDRIYKKYNRKNRLWQTNYHDHIIRDNSEFLRIKNYIANNPKKWAEDKFYKQYSL